jgi:competence protein ComEC
MLLAGATVPTIRAFIMTSLVLLAVILDRSALNMRLVALAALVVMIVTPESVTGPSFILSFAAVAALIVFYREIGNKLLVNANAYRPVWRPFYYLFGIIVTSIIATLATAPFSVLFFNRFAVWSVLSNIVAMPIMAFLVMPFGLIGTLLIPFEADGIFWTVMEEGIAAILLTAESIAAYPYASLYIPTPSIFETILISIGFIWLLLWQGCLRWGGLFLIILALTLTLTRQTQSIMISDDMKAILVVDKYADNLLLIGKMNGYLKRHWFGFHGYAPDVDIPNYKDGINLNSETIQCDDFLCNVAFYDTKITILINPLGLKKACETADILIASIPASKRQCQSKTIIDRFDVWRHGATMVYVNSNKKPMIKTVH